MARAPIPATSLLAAPVYLATAGPVVDAESGTLAPVPAGAVPSGALLEATAVAEQVLGYMV